MRTKLDVAELIELAKEAARRGHYGTFAARARELGSEIEDQAFKDGYHTGLSDKVTADKTQHKPVLDMVTDDYTPVGFYNMLTRALNEGHWDAEEVLDRLHAWLAEQDQRQLTMPGVLDHIKHAQRAVKQLLPAEE